MAMTAYFDESGTHGKGSAAVVVGGFIADPLAWGAFRNELILLLARYGIGTYHASKLRGRRYRPFHLEFVNLLEKRIPYGVTASLTPRDYREIYKAEGAPRKLRQDTEYGL